MDNLTTDRLIAKKSENCHQNLIAAFFLSRKQRFDRASQFDNTNEKII